MSRIEFYKKYYEDLTPSTLSVSKNENKILISGFENQNKNNFMKSFEKGGQTNFNPDGAIKDKIVHASGEAGGMLVGKRHSNGGIKAINKSTGQPIEMEGGEVVITRNAVSDNTKRSFNGKMMTNRQILSAINESGGGVSFANGGQVPNNVAFDCNAEYEYGGKTMCGKDLAYAMGGRIQCGSCDWSWNRKDGGDDMYVCHKCGTDNTNEYKNGGITIKNNNMKKNNLKKTKRKGKNIMTFAKEIRKKDESWQDALKRAKIEMNKTNSKKSSNIDSELGKLKELIKEDKILKEYNYSKKNTKKSNTRLQKGGDVMSLGIANADAVYNKGGEVLKYSKILDILTDKIDDAVEDIASTYDQATHSKGEEVESKSRDGFIPFTNGGYSSRWFEYSNILEGSGMNLPTAPLDEKIEEFRERNREYALERFDEEYYEIVEELGGIENVNYSALEDAGYSFEADELDEFERDDDDSIMMEVEAFYYTPNNDRGEDGKHTIQLSGVVNLEAPYHRSGNLEDYIEERFTFDSYRELEDKLDKGLAKVVSWFEGDMYDKNPRELKIRRMESGGMTKNTPKRNWIAYDKEHLMDSISGMIVPKGKESDNPKPKDIKGFDRIDFAKGGMVSVDSKNINDIHKKYKNVSQLENGQTYAIIDGQNFNIFKDDKLKVSNNRVVGIKKPSYITGKMAKGGETQGYAKGGKTKRSKHSIMQDRRRVSSEPWEVAYQKRKSKMEKGGEIDGRYKVLLEKRDNSGKLYPPNLYWKGNDKNLIAEKVKEAKKDFPARKVFVTDEVGDREIYNYAKGGDVRDEGNMAKTYDGRIGKISKVYGLYYTLKFKDGKLPSKLTLHQKDIIFSDSKFYAKGGLTYADGGTIGEYPRVYIADLEAYNNGELKGEWLDLADYNDSEEFNDAVQDLLDGWGVEEYAIHDVENFPDGMYSEYMSTSDFDEIYDMIELAKNNDLPLDVVMEVVSQYDESAVEEYQGQYEDGEDFAYQLIDETGLESFYNPQYFIDISDMDRRIMAQEMADSYTDDIAYEDDGERVVEEAGLDVDEYRELDGEDDDKRDEILEKAKEIVRDELYETWYDGLDDPYDFLVNEQGLYSAEDFFKADFIQIDYGEIANALEQDYLFIENDKGLFVFNVR